MKQTPLIRLKDFYLHKSLYSLNARLSRVFTMATIFSTGTAVEDYLAKLQRRASIRAHTHRVRAERAAKGGES